MHWQLTYYVLPVFLSAVVATALACFAWYHRGTSGATAFCLLMLAAAEWSLGYALELMSPDLPMALFWHNGAWIGAAYAPTLWLVFVLQYTGQERWLTRRNVILMVIEPLITLLLVWTNEFHDLMEQTISWDTSGSFSTLHVEYGTWYWINTAYSYLLILLGTMLIFMFIGTLRRAAHIYLGQVGTLLIAVFVPWVGSALTTFGLSPFPKLDLAHFALTVSGLIWAWSIFRFRLFDIIPVARETAFESISDAVIVVDGQDRIVDLNSAAQHLAHCTALRAVGQPFVQIFSVWPELAECYRDMTDTYAEILVCREQAVRFFNLRVSPLYQRNGYLAVAGRVIVVSDMTQRIQAERLLRESEERFRQVFEEAPIGMAVVDLNGVLLQMNKAFCEMLGFCEQELIGRSLGVITHPDAVEKDQYLAAQMLKGVITSYKEEKRFLRKNHETLWADLTTTLMRDRDGQTIYGLMMLEDVFERKWAKQLEEERHHVAYELHDGLAQVAASVHQHLQAFASHYRPHSLQACEELDRVLELAQRSVKEARRLIAGLRPTALDDFGLATALRLQAEMLRAEGWAVRYDETLGSERLSPTLETTLFGVVQEALTNVRKHAHTTRARISLERQASKIRLEVQDWGCGFEPLTVLHVAYLGERLGLRGMQERVELVGGQLIVSSQPDVGTLLVIEIPLLSSDERSSYHGERAILQREDSISAVGDC